MSTYRPKDTITSDNTPVPHAISMVSPRFLTVGEVASRLSISVSTVWRMAKEDEAFPRPIQIGVRTTRWMLSEI